MRNFFLSDLLPAAWRVALLLLLTGGGWGMGFAQQDAQYSQYMFNHLAINPAYAGMREVFAGTLLYREQWTGIDGAPSTAALSAQMPLRRKKIGLGAEIISDKLGPRSVSAFMLSYSYRIPFLKGKLAFGLRMGFYNYVYNWNLITYKDQYDAYNQMTREKKISGTADFGFFYYTRTFYWGWSATHLNRGKIVQVSPDTVTRQSIHYFMPLSKAFEAGNVVVNPVLLIKSAENIPGMADIGVNVLLKERLWLGVSARSKYGLVFLVQYQISEYLKVGYSYDYGMNKIGRAGGGSHEIMLGYDVNLHGAKIIMPRFM